MDVYLIGKMRDTVRRKIRNPVPRKKRGISGIFADRYVVTGTYDTKQINLGSGFSFCNHGKRNLFTCAPVTVDEMKPVQTSMYRFIDGRGRMILDKGSYVSACSPVIWKEWEKRGIMETYSCDMMDLSEIMERDSDGRIRKTVIPVFTELEVRETNIPHVYYAEYQDVQCYDGVRSKLGKSTLVTEDVLNNICLPYACPANFPKEVVIQGPRANFSWNPNGYGKLSAFGFLTMKLMSVFIYGEHEAVRSFVPGIMNMMYEFFSLLPELDSARVDRMQESMGRYFDDLCRMMSESGFYGNVEYRTPIKCMVDEMETFSKSEMEMLLGEKRKDEYLDGFCESVDARRSLLGIFNGDAEDA